jgi:sporulation protein YlmC with PRC-barrel domain
MKNNELRNERLMPLSAMKDYKVAKDSLNVMGWGVVGADGESLGTVRDLIVDPQSMKVRYLSVAADKRYFTTDNDQYMLVPIGAAALDKSGKNVFVPSIDSRNISSYPVYLGGSISEDYEYAVRDTIMRSQNETLPDTPEVYRQEFDESVRESRAETRPISDDFYDNETYNENRFYTSDQEIRRDRTYTTGDVERTDTTADLHDESKPRSVEDSITTIERLENLRKRGSITEEEFILMKKRALNL